jgi:hypothetical protein
MITFAELETSGPFRVVSTATIDAAALARIAPDVRSTLRYASGVCMDAQPHCVGMLSILDRWGKTVDPDIWQPALKAARNANNARK